MSPLPLGDPGTGYKPVSQADMPQSFYRLAVERLRPSAKYVKHDHGTRESE
jgi:hypothetical protein